MKRILAVLLSACLAAAMAFGGPQSEKASAGAELIVANFAEPKSMDPHLVTGVPEHRIMGALFEGLVTNDPQTYEPVPGLAESWSVSADGMTWTFKLRKATWSDGVPITAQTVVKSWLRVLNPETGAQYAWFPSLFIKGAEDYNKKKAGPETVAIKAVDDSTFQMTTVGPLPYAIGALAHYSFDVVPIHAIEKFGKDWTKPENFVGNGAFRLETWKPQDRVTVVPNEKYWDRKAVKLARVTFLPGEDRNTGFLMYENKEVDWITDVPTGQMDAVKGRADFQTAPRLGSYYYIPQTQRPPLNDVRVRKALSLSFNRKDLVDKVSKAGEVPALSMVPPMAGYPAVKGNSENVELARKLLAEAGFPGGKGFPKLRILYNTSEAHKKIGEFVQQQWKENLGIDVELENQEWNSYLDNKANHKFDIARAGWIGDYVDPNTFLDMWVKGGGHNDGLYDNPKYDSLIKKASQMPAGKDRFAVLAEAEQILMTEDQGIIPIYFYVNKELIDLNKWGGWYTNVMGYHPVKYIYKK